MSEADLEEYEQFSREAEYMAQEILREYESIEG
jgi:hypothetical protein